MSDLIYAQRINDLADEIATRDAVRQEIADLETPWWLR